MSSLKNIPIRIFVGCMAVVALLVSCGDDPTPESPTPDPKPSNDTTQVDTVAIVPPSFFMPVMDFNKPIAPDTLKKWIKETGARIKEKSPSKMIFSMPQARFSEVCFYFDDKGNYVEAAIKVKKHDVITEDSLLNFIKGYGFQSSVKGFWFSTTNEYLNIDLYQDEEFYDIRVFETVRDLNPFLPFTDLGKDVSRKELKTAMAAKGYTFDSNRGNSYNLYFNTGNAWFPVFVVQYDKQTETPRFMMLYSKSKRAIRSPEIEAFFKNQGYDRDKSWQQYLPVFRHLDGLKATVTYPELGSTDGGGILLEATQNSAINLTAIDFPCLEFGKTVEEIKAFEAVRGRATTWVTNLLNAPTGDPYLLVHAYSFSAEGKYTESATLASEKAVVESQQFINLMINAGFDYDGIQPSGRHTYWHRTKNVVAIVDLNATRPTITYRPKP